jgi:hypothetical protein
MGDAGVSAPAARDGSRKRRKRRFADLLHRPTSPPAPLLKERGEKPSSSPSPSGEGLG